MPRFPTVHSNQADRGLFTSDEIRRLMWAECARAQRYRFPLTLLAIGVDRLEQLGDLYGIESRANILNELGGLLRGSTRESDWMGWASDNLFLALFPHAPREAGPIIARRLLDRSRRLVFDEGYSSVQITLSMGLTHRSPGEEYGFDELLEEARVARDRSFAAGGNRFSVHVPPPAPKEPPRPAPAPGPVAVDLTADLEQIGKALERVLSQRVRELFESMGEKMPDFGGREREVLELAVRNLEAERSRRENEHSRQIDLLQRRLSKLAESLQLTEEELRRVMSVKSIDPGVASIYRTVQGLSMEEADSERKKEMMAKIFEANIELRKQIPKGE